MERWLRCALLFAASKKLRTKRPGVYPLIERERESRLNNQRAILHVVLSKPSLNHHHGCSAAACCSTGPGRDARGAGVAEQETNIPAPPVRAVVVAPPGRRRGAPARRPPRADRAGEGGRGVVARRRTTRDRRRLSLSWSSGTGDARAGLGVERRGGRKATSRRAPAGPCGRGAAAAALESSVLSGRAAEAARRNARRGRSVFACSVGGMPGVRTDPRL